MTRLRQESSDWSMQSRGLQAELEREREERERDKEREREEWEREKEEWEREREERKAKVQKLMEHFQKESKVIISSFFFFSSFTVSVLHFHL